MHSNNVADNLAVQGYVWFVIDIGQLCTSWQGQMYQEPLSQKSVAEKLILTRLQQKVLSLETLLCEQKFWLLEIFHHVHGAVKLAKFRNFLNSLIFVSNAYIPNFRPLVNFLHLEKFVVGGCQSGFQGAEIYVQWTVLQGYLYPRDVSPRILLSKDTFVQGKVGLRCKFQISMIVYITFFIPS